MLIKESQSKKNNNNNNKVKWFARGVRQNEPSFRAKESCSLIQGMLLLSLLLSAFSLLALASHKGLPLAESERERVAVN